MADLPHHLEDVAPPEDVDLGPSLAERFFAGEREAVTEVTRRLTARLSSFPRSQLEGFVAEAIFKAFRERSTFDGANFMGWITRIGRNLALDDARRRQTRATAASMAVELIDESSSDADEMLRELERNRMLKMLRDCLQTLGEEFAEVLRLKYFEGLGYVEISQSTGKPIGSVSSRLNRGKAHVRNCMNRKMGDEKNKKLGDL